MRERRDLPVTAAAAGVERLRDSEGG
ncbi:uncharacterized protein G2W53_001194 [Senna tora]|uniref:Uncharacterized protein n=1 Tax=Senna tora TaxID=362788 RepID=A0A835CJ74_9FABA|nr:uncharacterized protein G2W53_001194 [Senna tora]